MEVQGWTYLWKPTGTGAGGVGSGVWCGAGPGDGLLPTRLDFFTNEQQENIVGAGMDGENGKDGGEIGPLSSLDLVDSLLNIDDHLDSYLKNLQPGMDSQFADPSVGLTYWGNPAQQGYFNQEELFQVGGGMPGSMAQQPGFMAAGGDPGLLYKPKQDGNRLQKTQAESGSSSGHPRSRKRSSSSNNEEPLGGIPENVTQQKNRLAQRRFRERQKAKVQNLHLEIEALKVKVDTLQMQNQALSSQNSILEKVLSMRDEQISSLQDDRDILSIEPKDDSSVSDLLRPLTLSCLKGRDVELSREDIKNFTGEQTAQIWQAYVAEMSEALISVQQDRAEALARIQELVNELCTVCMRVTEVNPGSMALLYSRRKYLSENDEVKAWQNILSSLELTKEQRREIVQLRNMLMPKLQTHMRERAELNLSISRGLPTFAVGHRIALEFIKTHQAIIRLKELLRGEHNAMIEFSTTIVKKVLNPVQIAKLVVQSYPVKPDLLAIASAIASEDNIDFGTMISTQPIEDSDIGIPLENQGAFASIFLNSTCGSEVSTDPLFSKLGMSAHHP